MTVIYFLPYIAHNFVGRDEGLAGVKISWLTGLPNGWLEKAESVKLVTAEGAGSGKPEPSSG
jgi:hypothetical protein